MSQEVYVRLREFLDRLPGGFPATDSGVELKILERLFTPEEAEITMQLKPLPEPVSSIAPRLGLSEEEAGKKLEDLSKQGSIYRVRIDGQPYYMAIHFVVGIYEFHLNSIDRELSELFEEYMPHLSEIWKTTPTKQLRVVPISGAVDAAPSVGTYDNIRERVKKADKIAVAPCICRKEQSLMGHECERPRETCMVFGNGAEYYVENGMGRYINLEEALALLDQAEEKALVLSPTNTQLLMNVCMCCKCCCGVLRQVTKFDKPAQHVNASFQASIDPDLCTACGTCLDRCQIDAINEGPAMEVNLDRCIGCGLCVPTCPEEAISMVPRDDTKPIPKGMPEMGVMILKERGIIK